MCFHAPRTTRLILFSLAWIAGCARSDTSELLPVHPVRGTLTYEGRPMGHAVVMFHPEAAGLVEGTPRGTTDEDGHYRLTTFRTDDGAPEGKYRVTIYWPTSLPQEGLDNADPLPPDRLKGAYANKKTTKLVVNVSGGQGDVDFALP